MSDHFFEEEVFNTKINTKTILRILKMTRPYPFLLFGFLLFIMMTSSIESLNNYIIKMIIDDGVINSDRHQLIMNIIKYGSLICLQSFTIFCFIYCAGLLSEKLQYDLRQKLFNHLQELSFSYYDKTPVGWIMARVNSDTSRIADLATWMLVDVVWAVTNITTAMIFMYILNKNLAFLILLILPVIIIVALKFKKLIILEYRKVRSANSKITGAYNENITGVRVVKALVREEKNLASFSKLTSNMYHSSFRAAWLSALFLPVVQIISSIGLAMIVWYGGLQVQIGGLTIGGIRAFIAYILFMLWPVQDLARVYSEMQNAIASAERVFSLLDTEPAIKNKPDCQDFTRLNTDIDFDQVNFFYNENKNVIRDLSLKIKYGETIALVGPTGGGKTTLVNLICRFYEPKSGRILINGIDYTNYRMEAYQSRIGVVLQTPHLFSGTIRENIRYGRLNSSDQEVEQAGKLSCADEFINNLPNGYNEEVGEAGVLLSVGQKQLISIARAILAEPDLIVMDEATSSIDSLTESLIQQGMRELLKKGTAIIIAHRLSTIRNADRILVIEDGRISESGTHHELMELKKHYYQLYSSQFRHEREMELHVFE